MDKEKENYAQINNDLLIMTSLALDLAQKLKEQKTALCFLKSGDVNCDYCECCDTCDACEKINDLY